MTFRPELRRPKGPRLNPGAPAGRMTEDYLRCGLCGAWRTVPGGRHRDGLDLRGWTWCDSSGLVHTRCLAYAPRERVAVPEPKGPPRKRRRRRDSTPRPGSPLTVPWDGPLWVRHAGGDVGAVLGRSARHPGTLLAVLEAVPEQRRVRSGRRVIVFRVPGRAARAWWSLSDCRPADPPPMDPAGPESLRSILSRT